MKQVSFMLLMAVTFCACSTTKVLKTEQADNVDFTKYKTYNFYELTASGDTISANYPKNVALLEKAITAQLQQRGYTQSSSNPDLLINIGIVVQEKIQTRQTDFRTDAPKYIGQRNYSWKSEEIETGRYREGTVTLHVVEAAQHKLIWKSGISDIIPEKESKTESVINEGIRKLFLKYPVSPKP